MTKKLKICGITSEETAEVLNEILPDYIGLIFAQSRRRIKDETAYALNKALRRDIRRVGVFVDKDMGRIVRLCRDGVLDDVQLHADLGEAFAETVKTRTQKTLIQTLRVGADGRVYGTPYACADYFLLDTHSSFQMGGTGKPFDWTHLPKLKKPYFLAGGIGLDNLAAAVKTDAFALDVSSGAEDASGQKDAEKIRRIAAIVRGKTQPEQPKSERQ